ncbi:ly6/PLAUR domain-containing protein 3-like [Phaenicophaeus curvirostris]|uniref:ly6/PLAUR domain-containing protein 3-like n=1 Tax=Phaenicophaeus curvirostris TaxID=33595 RepID=UPI0037F0F16B
MGLEGVRHGRLSLLWAGCARGLEGSTSRALQLGGLVLFARRRQCRGEACNGELGDSGGHPGNSSEQAPNGLRCYGCPDDGPCDPPSIVQCYGDLTACFYGNVTMSVGGESQWREVRGCAKSPGCEGQRGDEAVGLSGSCCAGDLCNGGPGNHTKTFFAPDRPRLELLPHGHGPTHPPAPTKMADNSTEMADGGTKMADSPTKRANNGTKMAAGPTKVNGTRQGVNGSFGGGVSPTKMAATQANMAAGGAHRVNGHLAKPNMAAADPNMATADPNMAAVDPNMVAADPNMAAADPNMAAADPNMAAADPNVAAADPGDKMAARDKMAAGRAGHQDGVKGRGQALGGAGWLLPLLLLPLL